MKIGILSDTHDDIEITKKTVDFLKQKKVDLVLHLGDYVSPPIVKLFKGLKLIGTFGNNDGYKEGLIKAFEEIGGEIKGNFAYLQIEEQKIALYHGEFLEISQALAQSQKPVNILLITADDLGYEAVGTFGRNIPELTPRLDKFAAEGVQFRQAHTNTPICMPSRSVMATGLYGVSSGMMGFVHMKRRVPTVMQTFQDSGYLTGILGKVSHSTPDMDFKWDFVHDYSELGSGRSPHKYAAYCKTFFELCKSEGKPFYLMVNSHDYFWS